MVNLRFFNSLISKHIKNLFSKLGFIKWLFKCFKINKLAHFGFSTLRFFGPEPPLTYTTDICPHRPTFLFNAFFCNSFWLCNDSSCKVVWWRSFCCLYLMAKSSIICCVKPIPMHPCFICINIVVTDTVICTLNVSIFNLVEAIFMC